jgi:hypothetical protein
MQFLQFSLPQHVSGINMPIIRSTISKYLPLLVGHTWKAAWVVPHWVSWSVHCSEDVARLWPHPKSGRYSLILLLMMGILVPKSVEAIKTAKTAYFVAYSRFFTFTVSKMHGHMDIKFTFLGLDERRN